jgi:hypothetical protein
MRLLLILCLATSALSAREVAITIDDLPRGGDGEISAEATKRMTATLLEPLATYKIRSRVLSTNAATLSALKRFC